MPRLINPALAIGGPPDALPADTETRPHVITAECPLSCLDGLLPRRTLNALIHGLPGDNGPHVTLADLVKSHNSLSQIRGIGVGGIANIERLLIAADLIETAEPEGW